MSHLSPSETAIISNMEDVSLTTPSPSSEAILLNDQEELPNIEAPNNRAAKRRREEESMEEPGPSSPTPNGTRMDAASRAHTSQLVKLAMSRMASGSTASSRTEINNQGKNNTFLTSLYTQQSNSFRFSLSDYSPTSNNQSDTMSKTNFVDSIVDLPSTSAGGSHSVTPSTSRTFNLDIPEIRVTLSNNGTDNNATNANRDPRNNAMVNNAPASTNRPPSHNAQPNNGYVNNAQPNNGNVNNQEALRPERQTSTSTLAHKGERLPLTRTEAELFRQLRNAQEKLMRYQLHHEYLSKYERAQMVPRGLTIKCPPYFAFTNPDIHRMWFEVLRLSSIRLLQVTIMNIGAKVDLLHVQWVNVITSIENNPTIADNIKVAIIEKVSSLVDVKKYALVQAKNQKWARDRQGLEDNRENIPPGPGAPRIKRQRVSRDQNRRRTQNTRPRGRQNPPQNNRNNRGLGRRTEIIQGLIDQLLPR